MIICSMNVKGLGAGEKKRKIREMVKNERVDVLALQETKIEDVDRRLCSTLWGGNDVGWCGVPSNCRSGGLITLWNPSKGKLVKSFFGNGFLGVCLEWGIMKRRCIIINVYAPCDLTSKKRLWVDVLMAKYGEIANLWCVLGDFNSVRGWRNGRGVVLCQLLRCLVKTLCGLIYLSKGWDSLIFLSLVGILRGFNRTGLV
jgi:exonuclease III